MKNQNNNIGALCQKIEGVAKREMKTPQDFGFLAERVFECTRQNVSVSTLKRLYGYVNTEGNLRRSTLDILSKYVGYRDWACFCHRDKEENIESNPLVAENLSADELCEGDSLCVSWLPDRKCVFRCTDYGRFVVAESQNSKLSVGDTFSCHLFIKGEPLYLDNLTMQGSAPVQYVCGRENGIDFVFIEEE